MIIDLACLQSGVISNSERHMKNNINQIYESLI
jgi:hypothetical protein